MDKVQKHNSFERNSFDVRLESAPSCTLLMK